MLEAERIISAIEPKPEQFIVTADTQAGGTGRNQNVWYSPAGGLWFTYCLKTSEVSHQITLLIGLCLNESLTEQYPSLKNRLQIKWPNDLMLEGKKLAGILVRHIHNYLIIGIGINTNNIVPALPGTFKPANLTDAFSFTVSNSGILSNLIINFTKELSNYNKSGISSYIESINQNLFGKDRVIEFDTENGIVTGTCKGISEDGALIMVRDNTEVISCYAGSVIRLIG